MKNIYPTIEMAPCIRFFGDFLLSYIMLFFAEAAAYFLPKLNKLNFQSMYGNHQRKLLYFISKLEIYLFSNIFLLVTFNNQQAVTSRLSKAFIWLMPGSNKRFIFNCFL